MKKITLLACACALFLAPVVNAQEVQYVEDPAQGYIFNRMQDNWFVQATGGVGVLMSYKDANMKLGKRFLAPKANLFIGKWFSPLLGVRIGGHFEQMKGAVAHDRYPSAIGVRTDMGDQMKDDARDVFGQKFNRIGVTGDVLFNVTNWLCGYKPGRFSFNVKGGRCEACGGNGYKTVEMNFLPDVYVPCEVCRGKRYNRETLEVRYKGKSIADILDMTINQAVEFFEAVPNILQKIKTIQEVGLGYIKLGQPSTTLSGGESQRVKLATELSKRDTGKTLYILDEPTTGLHFEDIRILMDVLQKLVERGNTVLIIEHNLDVIKLADHIIDMGPEGGRNGGEILSAGTPETVVKAKRGYTPRFLQGEL